MPKKKKYEVIGMLVTKGTKAILCPIPNSGRKEFDLGIDFIMTLKDALDSYNKHGEVRLILANLNWIIARRGLDWCEGDLKKLEKRA